VRKEILIAVLVLFLISLSAITGVYAIEENANIITISTEEVDITGDGHNEVISLKGIPYQDEDSYLKKIYIDVAASNKKKYKFHLESGSKAALQLVDLNHDGVKDLFASVLTGGRGGVSIYFLHSLKNFVQTDLTVPEPLEMDSHFLNGYKAEVRIAQTGKSYMFDLKDRKKYYNKLGLYYKEKLNEPTELTVKPYSRLKPISLADGKMGLKGTQRVTGIANADLIAFVESTWSYEKDHWKLISTEVKRAKK
jgi:uncharacterized protein YggU (UPF0235/DUF167 family)